MSVTSFKLFANYNKVTNESMNNFLKNISAEQWDRKFTGFFKSVHELCSHIYICDFNWLKRFKQLRAFKTLNTGFFEKNIAFSETAFIDIKEYFSMRTELDNIIINFINELTDEDLESILNFTDSKGRKIERKMESLIIHMFNHETFHRGMISLYLEQMGIENDFSGSLYKTNLT